MYLPEVTVDLDTWLPELEVLMDMSSISSTSLNLKSDNSMDINLSVASLRSDPVGWVLSANVASKNSALRHKVLCDAGNVTGPSSFSSTVYERIEKEKL